MSLDLGVVGLKAGVLHVRLDAALPPVVQAPADDLGPANTALGAIQLSVNIKTSERTKM